MSTTRSKGKSSDIEKDIPNKRKNEEPDLRKKKKKKPASRFNWKPHCTKLKEILEENKWYDPNPENLVFIANQMAPNAPGITAEIVRTKLRTAQLEKFLNKLTRQLATEKTEASSRSSSNSESSDYYGGSASDESDVEGIHDLNGFSNVPSFWIVETSEQRAYFTSRRLLMKAKHVSGTTSFDVEYMIEPPTVKEIIQLVSTNCPSSLIWLDPTQLRIQNQIKSWKPITWNVRLNAPPPLMPGLYRAEAKGQFSWIEMPFHAPVRYTNFGDSQIDIENEESTRNAFQRHRYQFGLVDPPINPEKDRNCGSPGSAGSGDSSSNASK